LATGQEGQAPNVTLWRLDGALLKALAGIGDVTYSVAFSVDGTILATAGRAGSGALNAFTPDLVKLWSVATGLLVQTIPATCGSYADSVTFSHDGKSLATAGITGPIEVWRVADGARITSIPYPTTVHNVHFSPDDSRLIAGGIDSRATVWTLPEGDLALTLPGIAEEQAEADFSPDGRLIASTGTGNTVKIWDASTGALLQTLNGHAAYVSHVLWMDNSRLLSDDWSGQILLWTSSAGIFGQADGWAIGTQALGMALSPDHSRLAIGGADRLSFLAP
jgi:WD40 repeat protein